MTSDSLIGKLEALSTMGEGNYADVPLDDVLKIVRQHMEYPKSDASDDGELASVVASAASLVGDKNAAITGLQPSEISDTVKLWDLLATEFANLQTGEDEPWTDGDYAMEAVRILKPYLRATEPVSVSLKKCVDAIALSGLYDSDINDAIDYYEAVAKAVLDAAGAAYVD